MQTLSSMFLVYMQYYRQFLTAADVFKYYALKCHQNWPFLLIGENVHYSKKYNIGNKLSTLYFKCLISEASNVMNTQQRLQVHNCNENLTLNSSWICHDKYQAP